MAKETWERVRHSEDLTLIIPEKEKPAPVKKEDKLISLRKVELVKMCKENKIKFRINATKKELVQALEKAVSK